MKITQLAPGIELYSDCFDDIENLINIAKKLQYTKVDHTTRTVSAWGARKDELVRYDEETQYIWNMVNDKINECMEHYKNKYHFIDIETEGLMFLEYGVGNFFNYHLDENQDVPRTTSVTVYLNDDYDGGEIEYEHFDLKVKPKLGDIAIFSSSYPYRHRVNLVTKGVRYAVVAWYRWKSLINFYPKTETQDRVPYNKE